MAKKSQKQLTIIGLETLGLVEQRGASSRYRVFVSDGSLLKAGRFLVGPNGALRFTEGSISQSGSWSGGQFHKALAFVGQRVEARKLPENDHLFPLVPIDAYQLVKAYLTPKATTK